MASSPLKLAVLLSGSGTTLQNLLDVIGRGELVARVEVVIGSRPGLKGLERAAAAGLRNTVVERAGFPSCAEFSRRVFSVCDEVKPDLVVLEWFLAVRRHQHPDARENVAMKLL